MTKERIFLDFIDLDLINKMVKGSMVEHLGIIFTTIGANFLIATMPVDHRTKQPMGLLHGGASVALAETMGSVGATLCIDAATHYAVGVEINMNHIKSVKGGLVTGIAKPIHIGKSTHVWGIEVKNEDDKLIGVSRITLAILGIKK